MKDEIRNLLAGPQPDRTLFYFNGKYRLLEAGKLQDVDQDQIPDILNTPDVQVIFIHQDFADPPDSITDPDERYTWIREHPVEPVIPDELKGRITQRFGVAEPETAEALMDLIAMAKRGD